MTKTQDCAAAPRSGGVGRLTICKPLTLLILALGGVPVAAHAAAPDQSMVAQAAAGSPACAQALPKIQSCITGAAQSSFSAGNLVALKSVADTLRGAMAKDKGAALYYRTYWLAYTDYLIASLALQSKDVDSARAAAIEADTLLDGLANKDQESYALQDLVLLARFAMSQPTEIGALVSKTTELKSRLADATSIRGLYALAVADFYTPKEYGGGQRAEGLLRQILAAPAESPSLLKPTWGQDDGAALLIQLLRKKGANDEAASLYKTWHQKYPDSVALTSVAGVS